MRACLILFGTAGLALGAAPPQPPRPNRFDRLIAQLGDDSFAKREAACKALEAIGKPAVRPLLKAAASSRDFEIRWRAHRVIQALGKRLPGLVQKAKEVHRTSWGYTHAYHTAFSPDGRLYLAGGDGCTLRLYDVKTGKQVRDLVGHTYWTQHAVFTPSGKQVLSVSADGTIRLWDVATGKQVRKFEGEKGGSNSVDLTRDGKWVVSGAGKDLQLWELATGKEVRKFKGHTAACMGIFSPDGKRILSSGYDRTMRLWDVASGKELRTFKGHTSILLGAFFLPGGKQALSYSCDQTARIWDLATGKEVRKLDLGPDLSDIRGLAVSPDGKTLLVGQDGPRRAARLIDLASGKEVHRFPMITNPCGLSFSRDGRLAASGSHRGFVYLWRMPGVFDLD
jgi:WD40 repeat protein